MKTYDPLRMVIKQNSNEKAAYNLGFDSGKEGAAQDYERELVSWRDWLKNMAKPGATRNAR
jgi:hypothetical protein